VVRQFQEHITRQIQQAIDIVDLVSESVTLKRQGQNFLGLCPFHQEKTPSFNVSPSKQIFKCFGCGVGGDVFTFVQLREKVGFVEAKQLLASRAGIALESTGGRGGSGDDKLALYKANDWARGQFRKWLRDAQLGQLARDYVQQRRLSEAVVEAFGLGLALDSWDALQKAAARDGLSPKVLMAAGLIRPNSTGGCRDTFHNRLMFPILDASGQVIGFGGRTMGDDRAKYLNTPETTIFDKGRHLYGLPLAREAITRRGRAIVVEGYTDCMMAHQFGFAETIATLGTALTSDHIRLLRRYTDNVCLVFDSDEAGTRAADRGLELFLTQQLDVRLAQVPEGKDPCDFLLAKGAEAFESTLNRASSALEFKWRTITARHGGAASGPARREAVEEFLRLVATSAVFRATDPIQRGLVLNQLAKLLGVPSSELHRQCARIGRRISERAANHGRTGQRPAFSNAVDGPPADTEQRALTEILEVIINEPGYVDVLGEHFDTGLFGNPDVRAVATAVVEMAREFGEFSVSELIARMQDANYARIITDLQQRGEARANYGATIEHNVRRLQQLRSERLSRETAQRLYLKAREMPKEDQNPLLATLDARAKQRRGPLPLNMTRGGARPESTEQAGKG
jgi:DNA primase